MVGIEICDSKLTNYRNVFLYFYLFIAILCAKMSSVYKPLNGLNVRKHHRRNPSLGRKLATYYAKYGKFRLILVAFDELNLGWVRLLWVFLN